MCFAGCLQPLCELTERSMEWQIWKGPRNAGLEEAEAGIKIAGRNINHLRYADDTTLMAQSKEELKSLLMKVKVVQLFFFFHPESPQGAALGAAAGLMAAASSVY